MAVISWLRALTVDKSRTFEDIRERVLQRSVDELRRSGALRAVLRAGDPAPAFKLQDQHGASVSLLDCLQDGPVLVTFFRGFWCAYCNEDLKALQEYSRPFLEAGLRVLCISPQTPALNRKTAEGLGLGFTILSDPGNKVAEAFGLRHALSHDVREVYTVLGVKLPEFNGDESWSMPMPGRFLIGTDGLINYAEANPDYSARPSPLDAIAQLGEVATCA